MTFLPPCLPPHLASGRCSYQILRLFALLTRSRYLPWFISFYSIYRPFLLPVNLVHRISQPWNQLLSNGRVLPTISLRRHTSFPCRTAAGPLQNLFNVRVHLGFVNQPSVTLPSHTLIHLYNSSRSWVCRCQRQLTPLHLLSISHSILQVSFIRSPVARLKQTRSYPTFYVYKSSASASVRKLMLSLLLLVHMVWTVVQFHIRWSTVLL